MVPGGSLPTQAVLFHASFPHQASLAPHLALEGATPPSPWTQRAGSRRQRQEGGEKSSPCTRLSETFIQNS